MLNELVKKQDNCFGGGGGLMSHDQGGGGEGLACPVDKYKL